jgi:hypothetical protein
MGNLRDKNDRALRAFLKAALTASDAIDLVPNLYISIDSENRSMTDADNNTVGIVDIKTVQGPELPLGSGCFMFTTLIRAKLPAAVQPNEDVNKHHAEIGDLIGAIQDAMRQSNNGQDYHYTAQLVSEAGNALAVDASGGTDPVQVKLAADNPDMGAYSCLNIVHTGEGGDKASNDKDEVDFVEIITFQSLCAGYGGYWN